MILCFWTDRQAWAKCIDQIKLLLKEQSDQVAIPSATFGLIAC